MLRSIKGLWRDEEGQGLVEYGLIIALVAIVVITVLTTMGDKLTNTFTKISNELPDAQ
ncbi:MAG: Flp family type IVb pilin [Firmicutes bacterium]|nr:Flp family type IVb pilin [Bacillota bacterium]